MSDNEPFSKNDVICITAVVCVVAICITVFQVARMMTGHY